MLHRNEPHVIQTVTIEGKFPCERWANVPENHGGKATTKLIACKELVF